MVTQINDPNSTGKFRQRPSDESQGMTLGDLIEFGLAALERGYSRSDYVSQRPKGRTRIGELSIRRADPPA
ncbi:hypothetical protein SAMN02982929_05301 [Saccharopolyspora kobensis]|uniref:Uncharacterized protein n=1 Tax=Saccharopolyspora kobensis TaxID=146035 RepID=A0A1H6DZH5_9PSEU|nr:hypothetical protein [Saccharopolyspora kobensis]SEG90732.1 hypothetical protein SAMN02982929_05301 [Saccharopolyspora kobensis]SFD93484.1 hypothetical protein SAMN05216506_107277 [Saccharopolyspora kobensis]